MLLREPFQMVRLIEKRCALTFGVGACEATGTHCYNTDETCTFRAALDLSATHAVDFVADGAQPWNEQAGAYQPALAIPALRGYQVAPTVLNVAGGTESRSAVGQRAVAQVRLADFAWNDIGQDPYPEERATDPMTRGTYWTRWLARHPYHTGYRLEIYEGYRGDTLAEMTRRVFAVEKMLADRAGVTITAVDPLSRITDGSLTVPPVSPGELAADITEAATTLSVAGAALADYPATGYLRIGAEVIAYTARAILGGLVFTGLTRGALGTEAAAHKRFQRVQRVAAWENVRADDVIDDLVTGFGGVDTDLRDATDWAAETNEWRPEYFLTFYITEPTDLREVLGGVLTQCLTDLWWDERLAEIRLRAQRPQADVPVLSSANDIVADTLTIDERPEDQATRVSVYFSPRSWVASLRETANYDRVIRWIDPLKEGQYGVVRERVVFAPGVQTIALAGTLAASIAARFRDMPLTARFQLAREDVFWTGDLVRLDHYLRTDADGVPVLRQFVLTSAESSQPEGRWSFLAESADVVGSLWAWVGEGDDFADASAEERATIGFWTDEDGRLPDGSKSQFGWL